MAITTRGAAAAAATLARALERQWAAHGSRSEPAYRYPAAMREGCAAALLDLVGGGSVLDPFCGGGSVLRAALDSRSRARVVGRDVSPLAVFCAAHRCSAPFDDGSAARFCRLVADQRSGDYDALFAAYGRRAAADAAGETRVIVECGDAREPFGGAPVDAVVTSPPYAHVYDYLRTARAARSAAADHRGDDPFFGTRPPAGRDWPESWRDDRELGARAARVKAAKKGTLAASDEAWRDDTRRWLAAARASLKPGGRLAAVVGDGAGGLGALDLTAAAADDVGFDFVASATIAPDRAPGLRPRGNRRTEHAVLFARPP